MKRMLREEKGYTLFIAVLVAILFVVLAISLLTVTMSGLAKNMTREEITQATALADKGIQHLMNQINNELQSVLKSHEEGMDLSSFNTTFNQTLAKYSCDDEEKKIKEQGNTGIYEACVDVDSYDKHSLEMPKKVTLIGEGIVDEREETLHLTVEMGGDPIPDTMKYAVSTYQTEGCKENSRQCANGEGNLFLHGGISIAGDIKVDGNLITTNRSSMQYLWNHWIDSYYPSAKPVPGESHPHLILQGNAYIFDSDKKPNYKDHIHRNDFTGSRYHTVNDIKEAFVGGEAPRIAQREPVRSEIPISKEKSRFKFHHDDPGVVRINTSLIGSSGITREIKNVNRPNDKVFPYFCTEGIWHDCIFNSKPQFGGNFHMIGKNTFKQFATAGNLQIGRSLGKKAKVEFKEGLYVEGDLEIKYDAEVRGPIFVNGDLIIGDTAFESEFKFDALIYVNGKVKIRHSRIEGLEKENGGKGSLIIYAKDDILIERNNRFEDDPAPIKGFFYSKNNIEAYGNEANIRIEGGISAQKIILNGIRGRASILPFKAAQFIEFRYYEGWKEQAKRDSRLQIVYDKDIINNYSDLVPEKRVYNVVSPKILEKQY